MTHSSFELLRTQSIAALKIRVEEYRHTKTGAQHIHLAADNDENVFLVALRTVPHDSTGVAHILEHTALCGSEKYPVRDPFFMMVRRSLNTFMNAFTSSDWTAYPFASQNLKDFNNLLDVYLDAVFFSRLDELDFAQEGHRIEFSEPGNANSELIFKGVVFNEMKGAMSSVSSQLWHKLCQYLYPSSTYHYNSGGDPEDIPNLTYEQLVHFYKTHYHPSNAIFMTYGNITAAVHQEKFETQVLSKFERLNNQISVADEKRYYAPIAVEEAYALDQNDASKIEQKNHLVFAWLLGKTTNLEESLEAQLIANILLDNSASPLQHLLETTELGQAPSPICGLDDSSLEIAFVAGLEGCRLEDVPKIEKLILHTLEQLATEGVDKELVEASLHQLEISQREIGGDGYPYGLQLILTALTSATHRGDPIALLDMDSALEKLRNKIQDPNFIRDSIRRLLIDNTHRVRFTFRPDLKMKDRIQLAEKTRLARIQTKLTEEEKLNIIARAKALQARQLQQDNEDILPKVGLADIPAKLHYVEGTKETVNDYSLRCYSAGTNGLVYQQITYKLPNISEQQLRALPYYCMSLTELGIGNLSYLETQRQQSALVGSINAFNSIRSLSHDAQQTDAYLTLSAKALTRNSAAMTQLMYDTLHQVKFNELDRIHELITQQRTRKEQSITGHGHSLAMSAACAGMSPASKIAHQLSGLEGINYLKELDDSLQEKESLEHFSHLLSSIHEQLIIAPKQFLIVGEQEHLNDYRQQLNHCWTTQSHSDKIQFLQLNPVQDVIRDAWITNTQVNFCAKAYPTVNSEHPDAPALTLLGGFLRNGFLHRCIREQGGAYGGGASQDGNSASFRFYSYRDPRLTETLDDFDHALEWLLENPHNQQALEEAILGVIGAMDKPGSPAGEAKSTYHAELFGRTREKRELFRHNILQVSIQDLQRVAQTYLIPSRASVAVVTHEGHRTTAEKLNFNIRTC